MRPAFSNSFAPWGSEAEVWFIASAVASSTRLTTNSCVSRMLRAVSFGSPSSRSPGQKPMMGGSLPRALKKLKGAAFNLPSRESDVTQAIGRGVMSEASIA